jgi:toxin CcdB
MSRFVAYARGSGPGFLLDCQADLLSDLNTRFVVPLLPRAEAPIPAARLNPLFEIRGVPCVMVTQFASTVSLRELGDPAASLANREHEILNALDMLITGF